VNAYFAANPFLEGARPLHQLMPSLLPFTRWELPTSNPIISIHQSDNTIVYRRDGVALNLTTVTNRELESLLHQGVASWRDVFKLRQYPKIETQKLANFLVLERVVFTGAEEVLLADVLTMKKEAEQAQNEFLQGNAMVKMFKDEKRWQLHFDSLSNPQNRIPDIRYPVPEKATHKFVHLTGEIVPYQKKDKRNASPDRTHTQKNSHTVISKHLHTPLFGDEDLNRDGIGLAYRIDRNQIKAMLEEDSHTYAHAWIGSEEAVKAYSKKIQARNYTDFDTFIMRAVDINTTKVNEVLAKENKAQLLSIIIRHDTAHNRQLAIKRVVEIKKELGQTLPILFYNPQKKTLTEYKRYQQQDDLISWRIGLPYHRYQESSAKKKLERLEQNIQNKTTWKIHGLWGGKPYENKKITTSSFLVLNEIKKAREAEKSNYKEHNYTWHQASLKVEQILAKSAKSKLFRDKDSIEFNKQLLQPVYLYEDEQLKL